jgi:hypothetical protein
MYMRKQWRILKLSQLDKIIDIVAMSVGNRSDMSKVRPSSASAALSSSLDVSDSRMSSKTESVDISISHSSSSKSFWNEKLCTQKSTFGASSRRDHFTPHGTKQNRFVLANDLDYWETIDEFGGNHGRLSNVRQQVEGRHTFVSPSPLSYRPHDANPHLSSTFLHKPATALILNSRYEDKDPMKARSLLSFDVRKDLGNPRYVNYPGKLLDYILLF